MANLPTRAIASIVKKEERRKWNEKDNVQRQIRLNASRVEDAQDYDEANFAFRGSPVRHKGGFTEADLFFDDFAGHKHEVIGNEFDNPDLIKSLWKN